jgi:hypothetical protein
MMTISDTTSRYKPGNDYCSLNELFRAEMGLIKSGNHEHFDVEQSERGSRRRD